MNTPAVTLCALIIAASLLSSGCGKSDVDVDVFDFAMLVASDAEQPEDPEDVWAVLRVEMCSNVGADDGVAVSVENWVLELPDGSPVWSADRAVLGGPQPALEVRGLYMLSKDECAAGWIVFAVPERVTSEVAIFTYSGEPARVSLP